MFGPMLPFLSDSEESIASLLEQAADLEVDNLWVDALNPRPRVWPAVAELLRDQFPDLRERYRRILFEKRTREQYLAGLRDRVTRAARRLSLTDRVVVCF